MDTVNVSIVLRDIIRITRPLSVFFQRNIVRTSSAICESGSFNDAPGEFV